MGSGFKINALWASFSKISLVLIRIVFLSILARLIDPEFFGIYGAFVLVVEFVSLFLNSVVNTNVVIDRDRFNQKQLEVSLIVFLFGICLFASIWLAAGYISVFLNIAILKEILKLHSWVVIFLVTNSALASFLEKDLNFKALAFRQVLAALVGTGLCTSILAYFDYGLMALIIGYQVAVCLEFLTLLWLNRKSKLYTTRLSDLSSTVRDLLRDYWKLVGSSLVNKLATKGDYIVVSKYLGVTNLGYYTKAYQIMAMPVSLFGEAIRKVGVATLSSNKANIEMKPLFLNATTFYYSLFLPLTVIVFDGADLIVLILLGKNWLAVIPPLQILSLALAFRLGYRLPAIFLKVERKFTTVFVIQSSYAISLITSSYLLIDKGIPGVAYAVVIAVSIQFAMMNLFASKLIAISFWSFIAAFRTPVILLGSLLILRGGALYILSLNKINIHALIISGVCLLITSIIFKDSIRSTWLAVNKK